MLVPQEPFRNSELSSVIKTVLTIPPIHLFKMSQADSVLSTVVPCELEPVIIPYTSLDSTTPNSLRDINRELEDADAVPAGVRITVEFDEDCPLAAQRISEDVREAIHVADFLDAGRVLLSVDKPDDCDAAENALRCCEERARREGVALQFESS